MSLIKKPGRDGVAVNRGDGRDGVVSAGMYAAINFISLFRVLF